MNLLQVLRHSRTSQLAIAALLVLIPFSFYLIVIDAAPRYLVDFTIYWEAAKLLNAGDSLYTSTITVLNRWQQPTEGYYLYPPLLAWGLSKYTWVDFETAKWWWCALSWICILIASAALAALAGRRFPTLHYYERFSACLFLVVCFEPIYSGVSDGQVAAILLALLSLAFLCVQWGTYWAAGAFIGLAAGIKITPALLILGFLSYRRFGGLAGFIVSALASLAVVGLDSSTSYSLSEFLHFLLTLAADEKHRDFTFNYAFDKAILLPFGLEAERGLRWLIKCLLLILAFWVSFRAYKEKYPELVCFSLLLCIMMLASPIMWFHHLAWALPAIAILMLQAPRHKEKLLPHATLALGLFFALSQTHLLQYWTYKQAPHFLKFTTMAPGLLVLLLAYNLWRTRKINNP